MERPLGQGGRDWLSIAPAVIAYDAQRSVYVAQQALVELCPAKFAKRVRLYAVLGGGADAAAEETKP